MRCLFLIFYLIVSFAANAQFADSFSDGNLTQNPVWTFNPADFEISGNRLHSKNPGPGSVRFAISTVASIAEPDLFAAEIELQINPSGVNYIDYFLVADSNCELSNNAWLLRIGDSKDNFSLYQKSAGQLKLVAQGKNGWLNQSSNHFRFELVQVHSSIRLLVTELNHGYSQLQFVIPDTVQFHGTHSGIQIQQSGTTAVGKHYFDNLYTGPVVSHSPAFQTTEVRCLEGDKLSLRFSEPIFSTDPIFFTLDGSTKPISAIVDSTDCHLLELSFPSGSLFQGRHQISQAGTESVYGSIAVPQTISFQYILPDTPRFGSLIFTEIMANPSPGTGLIPEAEYVEMQNISDKYIQLKNCKLSDPVSFALLPDSMIAPGQIFVICKLGTANFSGYGKTVYCSNFPSLNNDGDDLYFTTPNNDTIAQISYTSAWYGEPLKSNGGWSLELTDTSVWCVADGNWKAAGKGGGSPGTKNSNAGIFHPPANNFDHTYCNGNQSVQLWYQVPLAYQNTITTNLFTLAETGENPISVIRNSNGFMVQLQFATSFIPDQVYHLQTSGLRTCYGAIAADTTVAFGRPYSIQTDSGSLSINELLFDPVGDDADYLELVNTSGHIADLSSISIGNMDDSGNIKTSIPLGVRMQLFPGGYLLLTTNKESTCHMHPFHKRESMLQVTSLPVFANDKGHVVLLNSNLQVLESFPYTAQMHSPVLADNEGVSLEKINPLLNSENPGNWNSAAASAAYGSPGLPNSVYSILHETQSKFQLHQAWFSPDNDGNNDMLEIEYRMPHPGSYLTATVFAETGIWLGQLFSNYSLGESGSLFWNGNLGNTLISQGNYVVLLEYFHPGGQTGREKLTFSVLKTN